MLFILIDHRNHVKVCRNQSDTTCRRQVVLLQLFLKHFHVISMFNESNDHGKLLWTYFRQVYTTVFLFDGQFR